MKKIVYLLLLVSAFSIAGFASTKEVFTKDNKTTAPGKMNFEKSKAVVPDLRDCDNQSLKKFVAQLTVNLSCVTITYTGATAEAGIQIVNAGQGATLVAILEWYWCGGGYEQQHPPTPTLYA